MLVPGDTIRRVRLFHGFKVEQLAECIGVTARTVWRWEKEGLVVDSLPLQPGARSGPDWRRKYMNWLLERYEAPRVSDTRKKEG